MMMRWPLRVVLMIGVSFVSLVGVAERAWGDSFLDEANRVAGVTPGTKAVEDVLFPALAAMEPTATGGRELWDVITLPESDPLWDDLSSWAAGESQQAVLEALATVGDPDETYVMGIAYDSAESAPEVWREAGLFSSIGPGGEIGTIGFEYLDVIDTLTELALVEGKRRAIEADGQGSLDVLVDLLRFGRILAQRPSTIEKRTASVMMSMALERMRDVVYTHPDAFTSSMLQETVVELDDRTLKLNRIEFPVLERLAAEQALARGFVERGEARPVELASILTKSEISGTPLRSFSEFAWYEQLATQHAGWFDTQEKIEGVWRDFQTRWNNQNWNEPSLRLPTEWARTDPSRFALVREYGGVEGDVDLYRVLSDMRLRLVTELRGTYNALGVVAFEKENKSFPPVLQAIQPRYVSKLAFDPYNWNETLERQEDFGYFVPIRDQQFGPRELPQPYTVMVGSRLGGGAAGAGMELAVDVEEFDLEGDFGEVEQGAPMGTGMSRMDRGAGADVDGGMDFASMFAEGFAEGFEGEVAPPDDLFDMETGRLRVDVLREWLVESIETVPLNADEIQQTNQQMAMLAQMWTSPEAARQQTQGMLAMFTSDPEAGAMLQGLGMSVSQVENLILDLVEELAGNRTVQSSLEQVRNGQTLNERQVRDVTKAMVEVAIQDRYMEPVQEVIAAFAGGMGMGMGGGFGMGDSYPVLLDDSVFLLYSVGPNGQDDLAKTVGVGGEDVLIWPPLSSLEREQR